MKRTTRSPRKAKAKTKAKPRKLSNPKTKPAPTPYDEHKLKRVDQTLARALSDVGAFEPQELETDRAERVARELVDRHHVLWSLADLIDQPMRQRTPRDIASALTRALDERAVLRALAPALDAALGVTPSDTPMYTVKYTPGASPIASIKGLRLALAIGLGDAKDLYDRAKRWPEPIALRNAIDHATAMTMKAQIEADPMAGTCVVVPIDGAAPGVLTRVRRLLAAHAERGRLLEALRDLAERPSTTSEELNAVSDLATAIDTATQTWIDATPSVIARRLRALILDEHRFEAARQIAREGDPQVWDDVVIISARELEALGERAGDERYVAIARCAEVPKAEPGEDLCAYVAQGAQRIMEIVDTPSATALATTNAERLAGVHALPGITVSIEVERAPDGHVTVEIHDLPGAKAYGATVPEALDEALEVARPALGEWLERVLHNAETREEAAFSDALGQGETEEEKEEAGA